MDVYINPSRIEMLKLARQSKILYGNDELKFIANATTQYLYVADGYVFLHGDIKSKLNTKINQNSSDVMFGRIKPIDNKLVMISHPCSYHKNKMKHDWGWLKTYFDTDYLDKRGVNLESKN